MAQQPIGKKRGNVFYERKHLYFRFCGRDQSGFYRAAQDGDVAGHALHLLRSADGKNIAEYTPDEVREKLMPRLAQYGVKVSSIGSPVGKVGVEDEAGFAEHLAGWNACVRSASCWTAAISACSVSSSPHGKDPDSYRDVVIEKLRKFAAVAEKHDVILLHENEKDIYGDIRRALQGHF